MIVLGGCLMNLIGSCCDVKSKGKRKGGSRACEIYRLKFPAAAADRGLSEMALTGRGMAQPGRQDGSNSLYGVIANLRNLWDEEREGELEVRGNICMEVISSA
jgi:hypothetical protein